MAKISDSEFEAELIRRIEAIKKRNGNKINGGTWDGIFEVLTNEAEGKEEVE